MQKLALFFFVLIFFVSCSDCTDCGPFASEPYMRIRFYHASDSSANAVVLDSINHTWAGNYENYQDTVHTYQLPLNMNDDFSDFTLTYRDTADLNTYLTNELSVSYTRTYVKQPDNTIEVECTINEVISNFIKTNLVCADSLTCESNEAVYQIYR
ncbi:MAG: hypothetical protein KDC79_10110 [Cyclobacteriaceae bacterium]|nr:hypothetical protein [Cyclobacteriaceae bacterium]